MNHSNQVMRVMYGKSILGIHFVIIIGGANSLPALADTRHITPKF